VDCGESFNTQDGECDDFNGGPSLEAIVQCKDAGGTILIESSVTVGNQVVLESTDGKSLGILYCVILHLADVAIVQMFDIDASALSLKNTFGSLRLERCDEKNKSSFPTTGPSELVSNTPTNVPTAALSQLASTMPSAQSNGISCRDAGYFTYNYIKRNCAWLFRQPKRVRERACSVELDIAHAVCPETCEMTGFFVFNYIPRSCSWLSRKSKRVRDIACSEDNPARGICTETCNSC